ncbi:MAG: ABC transporter permease [Fidelibacterota bacterium]|nr:MAG: ABC transporter permease [Candidatus Neomarinimicrobiota bacterium]
MFKNYITIALRNILRHKTYSFINIFGFTIGIASCLLILLYITHEMSYDRFHEKADRTYRLAGDAKIGNAEVATAHSPAPTAAGFRNEFPEVEDATRFFNPGEQVTRYQDKLFNETGLLYADDNFFGVFDFRLLQGDPATALLEPNSIVLTEESALKYFGTEPAIGEILTIGNDNTAYEVTGVVQNPPDNSHFDFNMLLSMSSSDRGESDVWLNLFLYTYIVLREGNSPEALEAKFPGLYQKYMAPQLQQFAGISWEDFEEQGNRIGFFLQPLTSIHLHSNLDSELSPGGNPINLYIFSAIALFILLIACINFMNLSTARSASRAREVGVRKVLGSARSNLVRQFITESILFSILATILAIGVVELVLVPFNNIAGINLTFRLFNHWWMTASLVALTILVGIIAGSYPAFYLASFKPVDVLKGENRVGKQSGRFRSGLVVFQFAFSIGLIISTMLVFRQLGYVRNKDLGFDKENVIIIPNINRLGNRVAAFRQELKEQSPIINASTSSAIPAHSGFGGTLFKAEPPEDTGEGPTFTEEDQEFNNFSADYDYLETMKMELIGGRNFSPEFASDSAAFIINEAVARRFGWEDPVGRDIYVTGWEGQPRYRVVGVIKDYHFESLHKDIKPVVMSLGTTGNYLMARIQPGDVNKTLTMIEDKWREFAPNIPFDYSFMDEDFDALFRAEQSFGRIVSYFTGLTIFIACLGLFGLAAFTAERRTKEVGIRKALGASVPQVVGLLGKEFTTLLLIANVIAWPIAWYAMSKWLQNFAYRISLSWWTFLVAGALALLIALVTVSYQAVKAATANPVEALRYE